MIPSSVDLEELCAMLTRSWPETVSADSTIGDSAADNNNYAHRCPTPKRCEDDLICRDEASLLCSPEGSAFQPLYPLVPLPWDNEPPRPGKSFAVNVPLPWNAPSGAEADEDSQDQEEASDSSEKNASPHYRDAPSALNEEAMRVLSVCEKLLSAESKGRIGFSEKERALQEIKSLKTRFGTLKSIRHQETEPYPSRSSISRHQRRYSLGVEARRVLKSWVDDHLEDPYPTVNEKNQMAQAAGLTIKQVNDWFTNYRKRHWEGEMMVARI